MVVNEQVRKRQTALNLLSILEKKGKKSILLYVSIYKCHPFQIERERGRNLRDEVE